MMNCRSFEILKRMCAVFVLLIFVGCLSLWGCASKTPHKGREAEPPAFTEVPTLNDLKRLEEKRARLQKSIREEGPLQAPEPGDSRKKMPGE
jgi:hypothetical protein